MQKNKFTMSLSFILLGMSFNVHAQQEGEEEYKKYSAYITNYLKNTVEHCKVKMDGVFTECKSTGSEFYLPFAIVFHNNNAYITNENNSITVCNVGKNGGLVRCQATGLDIHNPYGIVIYNNYAYISSYHNRVSSCKFYADGSLKECQAEGTGFKHPFAIAINNGFTYVPNYGDTMPNNYPKGFGKNSVSSCKIRSSGHLTDCQKSSGFRLPNGIAFSKGYAYVTNFLINEVRKCKVNINGTLSECVSTGEGFLHPNGIAIHDGLAFISNFYKNTVSTCKIADNTELIDCKTSESMKGFRNEEQYNRFKYTVNYYGNSIDIYEIGKDNISHKSKESVGGFQGPIGIAFYKDNAYVINNDNTIRACKIRTEDGYLTSCTLRPRDNRPMGIALK